MTKSRTRRIKFNIKILLFLAIINSRIRGFYIFGSMRSGDFHGENNQTLSISRKNNRLNKNHNSKIIETFIYTHTYVYIWPQKIYP